MENAGEKYGHILQSVRSSSTCPELRVRMNTTTDTLYINSYKDGEESFEIGFMFDGQIVLYEEREEEFPFNIVKTTGIDVKPRYRYDEDRSEPVNCTLTYIEQNRFFNYNQDIERLRRYTHESVYIDFEIDMAISMIEKKFLVMMRDHLGLRMDPPKGDWPADPAPDPAIRCCSGELKETCHFDTEVE